MNIIFMGTPQFAVVCLQKLVASGQHISAVVTAPDKPVGRGQKLSPSPVKIEALKSGLPVLQPISLKEPGFLTRVEDLKADLMIVVAFRILPEILFSKAKIGAVNLHGSLLPKYRGAAPINWAIINGESETGITTFFLKEKVDTGNIIDQEKIQISPFMTAGELHDLMAIKGADLILKTIKKIESGQVTTFVQRESEVSAAPKIFPNDCLINFNQPAKKIHDFIRGLSPKPGAYTYLKNKRLHLFRSNIADEQTKNDDVGTIINTGNSTVLSIQCNPGIIEVKELRLEGTHRMSVADFLRGHRLPPDTHLGSGHKNPAVKT
jgi:methionyl-tRNA formyltransferase